MGLMLVGSPSLLLSTGRGTAGTVKTSRMPASASAAVSQNNPSRPSRVDSGTDSIMESRKALPMPIPMIAITMGRRSGLLTSAARAMATPAIAPQPCKARPAMSQDMDSASAATTPPRANRPRPRRSTGFLPQRSDSQPKGCCSRA